MKTNAKEYLRDVKRRDADDGIGLFSVLAGDLAARMHRMIKIDRALKSNESRNFHSKSVMVGGERIEIQISDRREQYEKRKKRAELTGLGF